MKRGLFRCNILQSARLDFCTYDLFPGISIDFHSMMFTKFLMKDLPRVLIHVRKLFNCGVSSVMLFSKFGSFLRAKQDGQASKFIYFACFSKVFISVIIPEYKKLIYFKLGEYSSKSMNNFFILHLVSIDHKI